MADRYELRINEETKAGFVALAADLGFVVVGSGGYAGMASTPLLVAAMVAAWRRDSVGFAAGLAALLESPADSDIK